MVVDRFTSILELIKKAELNSNSSTALSTVASQLSVSSGATVGLLHGTNDLTRFCASGPLAQRLLDHESTVDEGPCLTSSTTDEAVIEPDLGAPGPTR